MSDFTAGQLRLIEWLALPKYDRQPPNLAMLAAEIGVDERTLYRWQKLDGFTDEVNKLARQSIGKKLPEVYGALLREAEKGEFQHIKLLLELAGEYTETKRNVNEMSGEISHNVTFTWADSGTEDD